jgi:hypothetical protein
MRDSELTRSKNDQFFINEGSKRLESDRDRARKRTI